jgi:hypothetical protein
VTDDVIIEMNKSDIAFAAVSIADFVPPPAPARAAPAPASAPAPKKARQTKAARAN